MGIGNLFETRNNSTTPPKWFLDACGGAAKAGVNVNTTTALSLTAVWACINKISTTLGLMPLQIYERTKDGEERAPEHPLYRLLHDRPNEYMTAYDWRQITMTYMLLHGASFSEIEYNGAGIPIAIHPLETPKVTPKKLKNRQLAYQITDENNRQKILKPSELLIFRYVPDIDGGWRSPITVHRETIGAALAVKEFGARTFSQGTNPAGVISGVAKAINEDAVKSLRERFAGYEGLSNSHRLMLLEAGEKFEKIGLPPQDAQYLESKAFDITEIARIYDVPPVLIHELTKTTSWGSGIESLKDGFISLTMAPHCAKIESEINAKLVSIDNNKYYCKFVMDGLLRGAFKDRMIAYVQAVNNGILTRNEVRKMENRKPVEGGDHITAPLNLATIENLIKEM